ncbi:MAG: SGNH/GDSL hydrolase family protein [Planctomycetia bacterium]|nr:SGNH/GDSL hydrolase family protein [Planctomycetia bacterium]
MKKHAFIVRTVASSIGCMLLPFMAAAGEKISNEGLLARWETHAMETRQSAPGVPLQPLGLYRDEACMEPATAEGEFVAAFRDERTGHGLTFKQADLAKRATLRFVEGRPVLRFDGIDDHYLIETKVPLVTLDYWVRYRILKAAPAANTAILSGLSPPGLNFTGPDGFRLQTQDYERSTAQNIMQVVHVSARAKRFKMSVDGLPIAEGDCFAGTSTKLCIGAQLVPYPAGFTAMDLEAVILGSDVAAERRTQIDRHLGTRLDVPRIVCVGDSITDGTHGGFGLVATEEYPSQLQLLLPQTFIVNSGQWGASVGSLPKVDQLYSTGAKLVVFVGTNDLAGNRTAEATFDDLAAYCKARRKLGWEVYVGTALPRCSGPPTRVPPDFEAKRQALNQKIRDNYSSFATGLVDFAADPRIGEPGDEKDTTYYNKDEVHTTAAGAKVLAELVFQVLSRKAG